MVILISPVAAQQQHNQNDDLADSQAWHPELQAYQRWQSAMEQKKRDLAFAELQLNWLKKQVEIAHQQRLLKPSAVAVAREPVNCIRIADDDWRLTGDVKHWSWGTRVATQVKQQTGCF
ncbi:hypothetical protein DFP83_101156 [Idiomarina fontislapidosi]|uniref:Uncharacterized protein n=1 Tax=Idiomarina fontislapidosi TaxID=263723 RepID=A0A432YB06_9GAMM|nr:hypothetical protein [Idiomarina fontislapidosi]PYE35281.1 hypothetical protein DFP83_101156 [Idiomarina fontislapidosi]RUO58170.1 hypothetical protein CWE25_00800 [Idiomarina fontislapidosi]